MRAVQWLSLLGEGSVPVRIKDNGRTTLLPVLYPFLTESADGREGEFRNRYRLTYPIRHDPHRVVWQIDHKAPLHILVRDLRATSHRTASGEVRPFLTLVVDSASRLMMAGLLSYDEPNRFTVAAAIRDAMLGGLTNETGEDKPFGGLPIGGVPDEIGIDNGKDLIGNCSVTVQPSMVSHQSR